MGLLSFSIVSIAIPAYHVASAAQVNVSITSGSSTKTTDAYAPNPLEINVGDTVTWTNDDSQAHTVTSGTGTNDPNKGQAFDSSPNFNPIMAPGATFSHTFEEAGDFPYFCALHPNMVGTVMVEGSESASITVYTDRSFYETDDTVTVSGRLTATNIDQPIVIQVMDPEGNRDRLDQFDVVADGSFSYSFEAGDLMNTDGTYAIIVLYKTVSAETTFQFSAIDDTFWRTYSLIIEGETYPIRYQITGGSLVSMEADVATSTLTVTISASSNGQLSIELPRSLIDSRSGADGRTGADDAYVVFTDGVESNVDETSSSSTRTLTIDFNRGDSRIEIVGTSILGGSGSDESSSITVRIDRSSYETDDTIIVSGQLTATNIDQPLRIQVIDPEGDRDRLDEFEAAADGSYSYEFSAGGLMNTDGTYTLIVSYRTTSAEQTFYFDAESQSGASLDISSDESSYSFGETVTIAVRIAGTGISGQNVAVSVSSPTESTIISRTVTTDDGGYASLSFRIADDFRAGTYRAISTALVNGVSLQSNAEFRVGASSSGISIISIEATDQQGSPVSSFSKGSLGYVKVVVSAQASTTALITVNIFDSDLTSLGVGSLKTTLGSGNSEMVISFFVSGDAASGQSDVYANIFSDWPASGGLPLTQESSVQVRI